MLSIYTNENVKNNIKLNPLIIFINCNLYKFVICINYFFIFSILNKALLIKGCYFSGHYKYSLLLSSPKQETISRQYLPLLREFSVFAGGFMPYFASLYKKVGIVLYFNKRMNDKNIFKIKIIKC